MTRAEYNRIKSTGENYFCAIGYAPHDLQRICYASEFRNDMVLVSGVGYYHYRSIVLCKK